MLPWCFFCAVQSTIDTCVLLLLAPCPALAGMHGHRQAARPVLGWRYAAATIPTSKHPLPVPRRTPFQPSPTCFNVMRPPPPAADRFCTAACRCAPCPLLAPANDPFCTVACQLQACTACGYLQLFAPRGGRGGTAQCSAELLPVYRIKHRCVRLWGHFTPILNSACSPAWRGSPTVAHHPQVLFQAATCRPAGGPRRPLLAAGPPQLQGVPLRRLKLSALRCRLFLRVPSPSATTVQC